jgi:hypothetical protein
VCRAKQRDLLNFVWRTVSVAIGKSISLTCRFNASEILSPVAAMSPNSVL